MPIPKDYRSYTAFDLGRVHAAGKHLGKTDYWKLFAIENMLRVIVHSVLSAQVGANSWSTAAPAAVAKSVLSRRQDYAKRPWHSTPGKHEVYYLQLPELTNVMQVNSNQFRPIVPQIDNWIAQAELLRLPRNIVGRMNWPSKPDRQRIDVFHSDLQALLRQLSNGGVALKIPPR